jgi:hypothetical protein
MQDDRQVFFDVFGTVLAIAVIFVIYYILRGLLR